MLFSLVRLRRDRDGSDIDRGEAQGEATDAALIERARSGDLTSFNVLIARHERAVYSVALRYTRAPELAEDVTQDAFVRAWRSLDSFRNDAGEGFRSWLLRIASNRALDMLRAQTRRPADSLDARLDDEERSWEPVEHGDSPSDLAERSELGAYLESALGQLHPDQRIVIVLSDVHGYPYDEIASITGIPIGTVKSRINRGRTRLRELLIADATSRELLGRHGRLESDDARG